MHRYISQNRVTLQGVLLADVIVKTPRQYETIYLTVETMVGEKTQVHEVVSTNNMVVTMGRGLKEGQEVLIEGQMLTVREKDQVGRIIPKQKVRANRLSYRKLDETREG